MPISATGHSYGDWSITVKSTCRSTGEQARVCSSCGNKETKVIRQLTHKWKAATCTAPKTCERCLATVGAPTDHTVNCNGRCTECGANFIVDIKALVGRPRGESLIEMYSSGNIRVYWVAENLSQKTVTSYSLTIYFYDQNGNPAYDSKTAKANYTITVVGGAISPGDYLILNNVVGSVPDCEKITIGEIKVQYSDGTSVTGWYGYGWKIQY